MRIPLFVTLFGLAALAAACGGGGGSNMLPGTGGSTGGAPPTSSTSRRATMTFYIPPGNKQASRKPLYISSNTQSFGILAVLASSAETPTPQNLVIYPLTT